MDQLILTLGEEWEILKLVEGWTEGKEDVGLNMDPYFRGDGEQGNGSRSAKRAID